MNENYEGNNLVELLQYRAVHQADKVAYTFLDGDEQETGSLTFSQLDARVKLIAAHLQHRVKSGDRALLVYPPGLEYVVGFFSCLYSGIIPVPVYPPRENGNLKRLLSIANDCQATLVMSIHQARIQLQATGGPWGGQMPFQLIETDKLTPAPDASTETWQEPKIAGSTIAFLQYTSGSTSAPKGVMVTHSNLMHNLGAIKKMFGFSQESIIVSWLPIYHDMGLIGAVLSPVYLGGKCVLFSPADFIQRPAKWVKTVSRYKGTSTVAPNFAFDLCTRKTSAEQLEQLELSSLSVAVNGAEPVRAHTLRRFWETFEPCGLKTTVPRAAYGLAEATLLVAASPEGATLIKSFDTDSLSQNLAVEVAESCKNSRVLVGYGKGISDQQIEIVDPETLTARPSGSVGEVWIKSPSVAQGYWNKPEITQAIFQAYTADSRSGPFLRTGDLGFVHQGELYVTGRHKDLIIVNGRNYYPQDIEFTAEQSHPALRPGCGAAFSVPGEDGERTVLAYEINRSFARGVDLDEIAGCIRRAIAEEHELEVHTVVFLKSATIPKTSSGKIQRSLCRAKFLSKSLDWFQDVKASPAALVDKPQLAHPAGSLCELPMQFSLFYFSSNEAEFQSHKYRLLLEGARFADEHGFSAVWVPERHFHAFGGLYPNPSVLASALAVKTRRIRIRAGSVVLPLHNPIRVAEEWSVVDNLSDGRVDVAFARGWNPNDFVLAPSNYSESLKVLFENIDIVRTLWRGGAIPVPNGKGEPTQIRIYPLPQQPELNIWLTCSGGEQRFIEAGAAGVNILTALLFQSVDELAQKLASYRQARLRAGLDPVKGHVTLMMHTYLGTDHEEVKNKVRGPFIEYLKSSVDLWQNGSQDLKSLTEEQRREVLNLAFERYYHTSGLFGTPETCLETIQKLHRIGVDEIACLIDFGIEPEDTLKGLHALHWLQEKTRGSANAGAPRLAPAAAAGVTNGTHDGMSDRKPEFAALPSVQNQTEYVNGRQDESSLENRAVVSLVQQAVTAVISRVTQLRPEVIVSSKHFLTLGINSLKGAEILDGIQKQFDLKLPYSLLFEFPTVERLSEMLLREHKDHLIGQMFKRPNENKAAAEQIPSPT